MIAIDPFYNNAQGFACIIMCLIIGHPPPNETLVKVTDLLGKSKGSFSFGVCSFSSCDGC